MYPDLAGIMNGGMMVTGNTVIDTAALCPLQVDPANGTVTCTGTGRSVGDICTYTCNVDFELIGPMTTTCTEAADGNSAAFSPAPPAVCRREYYLNLTRTV